MLSDRKLHVLMVSNQEDVMVNSFYYAKKLFKLEIYIISYDLYLF